MSLRDTLSGSLKASLKGKDQISTRTLRLILAALKDRDIEARGNGNAENIDDEAVLLMMTTMIKQRRESISHYEQAGRIDLAQSEQDEIEVIERFLPKQMDASEIDAAARAVIAELGANCVKDMGRTMAAMKQRYAGQMDFAKASAVVKSLLVEHC
jgi:uncharacterized protein YqeY